MSSKALDYDSLSENVKKVAYAVRGELYLRASELQKEGKKVCGLQLLISFLVNQSCLCRLWFFYCFCPVLTLLRNNILSTCVLKSCGTIAVQNIKF